MYETISLAIILIIIFQLCTSLGVLAASNTVVVHIHFIAIYRVHIVLLGIFVECVHHDESNADVFANHVGYPNQ